MNNNKNKKENTSTKVAIYLRVSTDEQVEMYGKDSQLNAIKKLIESRSSEYVENGLEFAGEDHIYYDEGVSGTLPVNKRPQFSRMMENYRIAPKGNKPFGAVAVYKIDRLARKLKVLMEIIEYFEDTENEIKLISVNENIDTSTPFGRAMLNIMGVIAELEIETIKERMQGGRNAAVEKGKIMGTAPILGYIKDNDGKLKIQKNESKIVKTIFDLFVMQNKTPIEIANILKEKEILTAAGWSKKNKKSSAQYKQKNEPYHWTDSMIRKVLSDDLYTGKYYYNKSKNKKKLDKKDWTLAEYKHPIIIDSLTFKKAQERISELSRMKNSQRENTHTYILQGLLKCDSCKEFNDHMSHWNGTVKKVKGSGNKTFSYKCGRKSTVKYSNTCNTIPIPALEIEEYVINYTKKLLSNPLPVLKYQEQLKSSKIEINIIKKELDDIRKRLNNIPHEKDALLLHHRKKYISDSKLDTEMQTLLSKEISLNEKYKKLNFDLAKKTSYTEYEGTLKELSKHKKKLDNIFNDRVKTKEILGYLYDEIIIYSRPLKKTDIIAGVKKGEQLIPYKIHMRMKLPQDIISQLPKMINPKEKSSDSSDDNSNFNFGGSTPKSVFGGENNSILELYEYIYKNFIFINKVNDEYYDILKANYTKKEKITF